MNAALSRKAFTLIETLIYVALFSMVLEGTFVGFAALSESAQRTQTEAYLVFEGMFLLDKISYAINDARLISVPESGGSNTQLILTSNEGERQVFETASERLLLTRGGISPIPISGNTIQVRDVSFVRTTHPNSIAASFTLMASTTNGQLVHKTFSGVMPFL